MKDIKNNKKFSGFKFKKFSLFIIVAELLVFILVWFLPKYKKRLKKIFREEKREVKELVRKEESAGRFCRDSLKLVKDFFIPHAGNDYQPFSVRPKSLAIYLIIAIFLKAVLSGFLFFVYPTPAELSTTIIEKMVELTNQAREDNGVQPLKINLNLAAAAQAKVKDMIARNYFSHDSLDGRKPWQWIDRDQYDYIYAGENLAMGFSSAEMVFSAFMKSPSHQKNILNPKYQEIGLAVLDGKINGEETTVLVEFFGTQQPTAALSPAGNLARIALENNLPKARSVNKPQNSADSQLPVANVKASETENKTVNQISTSPDFAVSGSMIVVPEKNSGKNLVDLAIYYFNIIFLFFLIFILISLILTVFIKIRVQYPSLILQTLAVIAIISAIILIKFHFLERITSQFLIT